MRRAAPALFALLALAAAGCVVYPTVMDAGGVRIRSQNGRAVRQADGAAVYFELASTGKFGDTLLGASAPVARQATVLGAGGAPAASLEIPGATTVVFKPGGPYVLLADLTRPLVPGEAIIVTLSLQKSGPLGVVAVVE